MDLPFGGAAITATAGNVRVWRDLRLEFEKAPSCLSDVTLTVSEPGKALVRIQPPAVVTEFVAEAKRLYGLYFDSTQGYKLLHDSIKKHHLDLGIQLRKKRLPVRQSELDAYELVYTKGPAGAPGTKYLHSSTQGDARNRNAQGGENHPRVGQAILVFLYALWEDYYRERFAEACGVEKNRIFAPIMGDLRWLRISIVHHKAIAKKEVERCEVLKWFKHNDRMDVTNDHMEEMFTQVHRFLLAFSFDTGPFIRTVQAPSPQLAPPGRT
jgi:hypothetical protein